MDAARWFERCWAPRPTSAAGERFALAVARTMQEISPPQVDPMQTARTHEGEGVLILVIPHRRLGGLTLVIGLVITIRKLGPLDYLGAALKLRAPETPRPTARIFLSWADVFNLNYHDDLDAAHPVASYEIDDLSSPNFEPALAKIRELLTWPLELRIWDGPASTPTYGECYYSGNVIARLGERPKGNQKYAEVVFRFADAEPPPLVVPSYSPLWFESESEAVAKFRALRREASNPRTEGTEPRQGDAQTSG